MGKIVGDALKVYVRIGNQSKIWWHRRARVCLPLAIALFCPWLSAQTSQTQGGTIHGVVKSGNMPLPGTTVTAANTLTGQKVTTSTDVDGSYLLQVSFDGPYVVRAQMAAFAPVTKQVVVNPRDGNAVVNLELLLLSRTQKTEPAE